MDRPVHGLSVRPPGADPSVTEFAWRVGRLARDAGLAAPEEVTDGDYKGAKDVAGARQAAVLFLLAADTSGMLSAVLTQRAAHLKSHPGQVALPGGRIESGETAVAAALREAEEEIALPQGAVQPLAVADAYLTRTGFVVRPVLGVLRAPALLVPAPDEVDAVFTVPFSLLRRAPEWERVRVTRDGHEFEYAELNYEGRRIWGVTAAILRQIENEVWRR